MADKPRITVTLPTEQIAELRRSPGLVGGQLLVLLVAEPDAGGVHVLVQFSWCAAALLVCRRAMAVWTGHA